MSLQRVAAPDVMPALESYSAIIDVRSPSEFAEDHLPGAINWPVLDDEERRIVGTLYKQVSAFEARKRGAALVARRIADHIDRWVAPVDKHWRPLVYCWRGGDRSGTMSWFLDRIGLRTSVIDGGYKAYRNQVREDLDTWPARFQWRVLCGKTGSGKTRLLHALARQGAQVLDLEGLAVHRGSVLGLPPGETQPSQKMLDSRIWQALRRFDPTRPVYVESESKKLGQRWLPEELIARMRADGRCVLVEMSDEARLQLLLEDYDHLHRDPENFCRLLGALVELRGRERVQQWQAQSRAGQTAAVFMDLMLQHYDPGYMSSLAQHFVGLAAARRLVLADGGEASLSDAARQLIADEG
ncbi:tRNA 2-selenouridine(34) synthase MnmH [Leptothrix discophora]|uniref:tRNA 2-selenouridine(34) synthase MnmH n=1 Tax=Leptothrix discophora TaxID=89 RepID=A0ABT9G1B4_LEPDI|nr:tRNA 2-selenouridine(34) synthase MnmH [Leptothrix discophora]MDP4300252.1 tRNA 2-selenouridine(34) synthase MnmH [Leptothrix discophora]